MKRVLIIGLFIVWACCYLQLSCVFASSLVVDEKLLGVENNEKNQLGESVNKTPIAVSNDDIAVANGTSSSSTEKTLTKMDTALAMSSGLISAGKGKQEVIDNLVSLGYTPAQSNIAYTQAQGDITGSVSSEAKVTSLYNEVLGRAPDAEGQEYWVGQVNNGMSIDQVKTYMTNSSEYKVKAAYNEVLGRAPDAEGQAYWVGQVNNGMSIDQVKSYMTNTAEYKVTAENKTKQVTAAPISLNIGYKSIEGVDSNLTSLDVYLPTDSSGSKASPLVVYVHGGGWTQGDKAGWEYGDVKQMASYFTSKGYAFASVNYRLAPDVNATESNQDVADAVSYLVDNAGTYNIDTSNINLMGHSAGGGIVAAISTDESYLANAGLTLASIKGTILLDAEGLDVSTSAQYATTNADPTMWTTAFGSDPDVWVKASPIQNISQGKDIPNFCIVSNGVNSLNQLAPIQRAESFKTNLENAGVQATLIKATTLSHVDINNAVGVDAVVTPAIQKFLDANRV